MPKLLNEHVFIEVRQREIHTLRPQLHERSASEFELVIENLKRLKSPRII